MTSENLENIIEDATLEAEAVQTPPTLDIDPALAAETEGDIMSTTTLLEKTVADAALPRKKKVDHAALKVIFRDLLIALGEDPEREGLIDTPRRMANFYRDFIEYDAGKIDTTFTAAQSGQMVGVTNMRVWSLCEHHMIPFYCDISVAYIADDKVLGLSKFARIAKKHAHNLSLQEKLIADIAGEVKDILGTDDVAVMGKGEHLCMTMRGAETPHQMVSSSMSGRFLEPDTRKEFIEMVNNAEKPRL